MLVPLLVPEVGVSTGSLRLSTWLVSLGEEVVTGDRMVEMLVPGMTFDIEAPVTGRLVRQEMHRDAVLATGDRLGWIEVLENDVLENGVAGERGEES